MHYVPIKRDEDEDNSIIFGRIGREFTVFENAGPEDNFENSEHSGWRASNFLLNTAPHKDGQKIVMQDRIEVGNPLAILNSMCSQINATYAKYGWHIDVNSITGKQTFWDAVKKNKGQITRAEFTYITPNVLGIRSLINERLKEYREKENAQQVTVIITEPKGNLKLETKEVKDAIEYISEGGGSAKLKSGREVIYDSKDSIVAKDVGVDDSLQFNTSEGRLGLTERLLK